jgi:excisionase family DNA binding protein
VYESLTAADPDELLTTGEAARLLSCSRQHVVDLCDRGDLPFTTVRKHRRVRRSDIETLRSGSDRLTRDQRRSLWLSYAVAGAYVKDPEHAKQQARHTLEMMRSTARGQAQRWLDEWDRLLDGPDSKLLAALTSHSPRGRELRQNSPLSGVLSDEERFRALDAWRSSERQAGR